MKRLFSAHFFFHPFIYVFFFYWLLLSVIDLICDVPCPASALTDMCLMRAPGKNKTLG